MPPKPTITLENWDQTDSTCLVFAIQTPTGTRAMTANDWVQMLLEKPLPEHTPKKLHEMFQSAQACMIYGVKYYPLFSLGAEQITRIIEATLNWYAQANQIPVIQTDRKGKTRQVQFAQIIDVLKKHKLITQNEHDILQNYWREIRNMFSHATERSILPPRIYMDIYNNGTDLITTLVNRQTAKTPDPEPTPPTAPIAQSNPGDPQTC